MSRDEKMPQLKILMEKVGCLILAYFLVATPLLSSCGGGGSGATGDRNGDGELPEGVIGTIQQNTDPMDPMLCEIVGKEEGDKLILYGEKDLNGDPSTVDLVQYYIPIESNPFIFQLDDQGRPTGITFPQGEVATVTYDGDRMTFTLKDNDGNFYIDTFPLILPNSQITAKPLQHKPYQTGTILKKTVADASLQINGYVTLEAVYDEFPIDYINNATVYATVNKTEKIYPFLLGDGTTFKFNLIHPLTELFVEADICAKRLDGENTAWIVIGSSLAVMAFIVLTYFSAGVAPAMLTYAGWTGLIGTLGLGAQGYMISKESLKCVDYSRKKLIKSGQGNQSVVVTAIYNNKKKDSKEITYNIFDLNDTIVKNGFFISISFEIDPGIKSVSTKPSSPKVGESYILDISAWLPPGGYIDYEVSRSKEGYTHSNRWTNYGGWYDVNVSFSIPGAESEVTDTITAKSYVIDIGEGNPIKTDEKQIFVSFHEKSTSKSIKFIGTRSATLTATAKFGNGGVVTCTGNESIEIIKNDDGTLSGTFTRINFTAEWNNNGDAKSCRAESGSTGNISGTYGDGWFQFTTPVSAIVFTGTYTDNSFNGDGSTKGTLPVPNFGDADYTIKSSFSALRGLQQ